MKNPEKSITLAFIREEFEDELVADVRAAADRLGINMLTFDSVDDAKGKLDDAEIIFSYSGMLAENAPSLKWMCTPWAGANQFTEPEPKPVFTSGQAVLTNSSGAYGVTIAEHIAMVILESLRRQREYEEIIKNKGWGRELAVKSIAGSKVLFIGTGDIGQEAAKRIRAFVPETMIGMNRSGKNPDELFDSIINAGQLKETLADSDIVIVSLPGTKDTKCLLNQEIIDSVKYGALIVNVGRGSVIEQKALVNALKAKRLYAALDVFETEPIPQDDEIWNCPNLIITPHIAGNLTLPYTRKRIIEMFTENLERYCDGLPLKHRVDLKSGY